MKMKMKNKIEEKNKSSLLSLIKITLLFQNLLWSFETHNCMTMTCNCTIWYMIVTNDSTLTLNSKSKNKKINENENEKRNKNK